MKVQKLIRPRQFSAVKDLPRLLSLLVERLPHPQLYHSQRALTDLLVAKDEKVHELADVTGPQKDLLREPTAS